MRSMMAASALIGLLTLSGCTNLAGLRPFVSDEDAFVDTSLYGVWTNAGGDASYIVSGDGKTLAIRYTEKRGDPVRLVARLWKTGDALFADVTSATDEPFQLHAHSMLRIWRDGETVRLAFLDTNWLREQARPALKLEAVTDHLVITSPGADIRRFLMTAGMDPRAYGDPEILRRGR